MTYREVSMIKIKEILLRAASSYGVRVISKSLGIHKKTIKGYISLATELGAKLDSKDSITNELVGKIRAMLSADKNKKALTPRGEILLPHRVKIEEYLKKGIKSSKVIRLLAREGISVSRQIHWQECRCLTIFFASALSFCFPDRAGSFTVP